MTETCDGVELGVYEKALRWNGSWPALFEQVARAGFASVTFCRGGRWFARGELS